MDIRLTTDFRTSLRNARLVSFLFLLCGALFCAHDASAQVKRWVQPDSVPPLQGDAAPNPLPGTANRTTLSPRTRHPATSLL